MPYAPDLTGHAQKRKSRYYHGMTLANLELLNALKEAGASDATAQAAARTVATSSDAATKADLAAGLAGLEARLTWRLVGGIAVLLAAMTAFDLN